jgi:hypothetical protein
VEQERDVKMKKTLFLAALAVMVASAVAAVAGPRSKEAGLVMSVSGKVTYSAPESGRQPSEVTAYMKLEQDDLITVPEGGSIEVVYFSGNRREKWKGPAVFTVGAAGGSPVGVKNPARPEVSVVPDGAAYGVKRLPEFLRKAGFGRAGVTAVRGDPLGGAEKQPRHVLADDERKEIEAARSAYSEMKKKSANGDIVPELSFLCILGQYEQYDEMEKIVADALKANPGRGELEALKRWVAVEKRAVEQ